MIKSLVLINLLLVELQDQILQPIQDFFLILEISYLKLLKQDREVINLEDLALMLKVVDVRPVKVTE